jgi:hypothetical protein
MARSTLSTPLEVHREDLRISIMAKSWTNWSATRTETKTIKTFIVPTLAKFPPVAKQN